MTQQENPELEAAAPEEQPEATEAPDWQARAEAAETRASKAENDLNSQRGRGRQTDQWQNQLTNIGDRIGAIEQSNHAMIRAFSSGDTDTLPNELSTIQAQSAQISANRAYETRYAALSEELRAAVQDGEGNPILDLHQAPELETVRQQWVNAHKTKDIASLASLIAQTHRTVREAERNNGSSSEHKIRSEERNAAQERMVDAGIYDLDTGPTGDGGTGQDDMTWYSKTYAHMDSPTPADHNRAIKIGKQLKQGR